jgi:hypothetical protein
MSDHDYISGPHSDAETAVRAVGDAGDCAIVRLHHVDGSVLAHVWEVDEVALYLSGARAFLQVFAEDMSYEPARPRGTTGYATVIPPANVACLIDPAGTTTTVELGPEFQDDPVGRAQVYVRLRDVLTADRERARLMQTRPTESQVPPAARAFPPANTADAPNASPAPAPAATDLPPHRRNGR